MAAYARFLSRPLLPKLNFPIVAGVIRTQQYAINSTSVDICKSHVCSPLFSLQIRNTSFFGRLTADELWKGCTSVSNVGKKRGRGKRGASLLKKNLNRGQIIGVGEENMIWPGLNAPILKGKEVVEMRKLPPNPDHQANLFKLRDSSTRFRRLKLSPMERGYAGTKMPGRSLGPPDPVGEETFEGFDTRVIEFKTVSHMTANEGNRRSISALVVTGNRNGLAGFEIGKSRDGRSALRKAKNSAAKKLIYFERFNDHTLFHNFYAQYGRTKIFACKKPKGYGLVCHRILKTICEIIGIKDMYAKVEGKVKNRLNLTRAFFHGLQHQKTHQTMADETGLTVIELRKENDYFPTVIAKPQIVREEKPKKDIGSIPDYQEYISEGRVPLKRKKFPAFYTKLPSWQIYLKKTQYRRNHEKVKLEMLANYGEIRSPYSKKDPSELPVLKGVGYYK